MTRALEMSGSGHGAEPPMARESERDEPGIAGGTVRTRTDQHQDSASDPNVFVIPELGQEGVSRARGVTEPRRGGGVPADESGNS